MKTMTRIGLLAAALAIGGCGNAETMAEQGFVTGDVTSCVRNQDLIDCGPQIYCSRPIQACIEDGCRIDGSGLALYADGSWSEPNTGPGPGVWSLSQADGWTAVLSVGDSVFNVGDPSVSNLIACPNQ